jgi:hypothetical protein
MEPRPDEQRDAGRSQQLLTALTTEHFTLQGARSQTMSESSARASIYILSVSSALVAMGFIGQTSATGDAFNVFALTVLPTVYLLGAVTFVRLVECGPVGVFANMGLPLEGRTPLFAFSTAVAVINGVVGGGIAAIALGALADASLGVAAAAGAVAAIVSVAAWLRYADRLLDASAAGTEPLFPTPRVPGASAGRSS